MKMGWMSSHKSFRVNDFIPLLGSLTMSFATEVPSKSELNTLESEKLLRINAKRLMNSFSHVGGPTIVGSDATDNVLNCAL